MSSNKQLKLTIIRSMNGRLKSHKSCARGLGLRKMNHSVIVDGTPENLGMINKISYMLRVEEV